MELLYIAQYQFELKNGRFFTRPAYGNAFWEKYLEFFSTIHIMGIKLRSKSNKIGLIPITNDKITVELIPENIHPKDLKYDGIIKRALDERIKKAEAIILKPDSRKGIMAIALAEKYKVPYMIEMTGDFYSHLRTQDNPLIRVYSHILYYQVHRAIRNCEFGLYVTKEYLQRIYPIKGEQCGCSDVIIPDPSSEALSQRIKRINDSRKNNCFKLGLVGGYRNKRKGIDTAIKALRLVATCKLELHILGSGTEEDRIRWYEYAEKNGVKDKLFFDGSLLSSSEVLSWYDSIDIIILPSRSEGLPRCIVEAQSRGCPCITSNVCGLPELVDISWTHDQGDYSRLADLIIEMTSDESQMKKAAETNFKRSKGYTKDLLEKTRRDFFCRYLKYIEVNAEKRVETITK